MKKVKKTERGWTGHFICSCQFRRNTLLEYDNDKIVVSTVGLMLKDVNTREYEEIGCDRYYETMAFHADMKDTRYYDIDVSKEIDFDSDWCINIIDADDKANDMHEKVVKELSNKLKKGTIKLK